ncbi:MAG: hypothetical protein GAK45_01415 [Pseudomonas citronellolis]|nr:MAG: hypothetical protein GAK45_01415 [Pseudomonas citronellolis]
MDGYLSRRASLAARLLLILLCCLPLRMALADGVPEGAIALPLSERVIDVTHTLDRATRERLVGKLRALERRRGAQLVVVMLPTVGKMGIEAFSNKLFNLWKLGRKGVDDGILLVVAKDDHRMRIEVGYGLEGVVPDVIAGRIIREHMTPAFRQGDFAGGIETAVDDLIGLIDGEPLPEPVAPAFPLEGWLLLGAFVFGAVAGVLLIAGRVNWRWLLAASLLMMGLVGVCAGGKDWAMAVLVTPICILVGGATFGALWQARAAFYAVLGLIVWSGLLGVAAQRYGGMVFGYGLGLPLGLGLVAGLWWLAIAQMREGYRKGLKNAKARKGFHVRLVVMLVIFGLMALLMASKGDFWNLLALLPFGPILMLVLFGRSGGRGSGSGSSGGSSGGGGGFSGGGGSSGGGGASGSW